MKICGITRVQDAVAAEAAGADAIGLIFAPGSRRCVSLARAAEISAAAGPWITRVGVFSGAAEDEILRAAAAARLDVVQLHGDAVDTGSLERLRRHLRVVRALRFDPGLVPEEAFALPVDAVLLDGPAAGSGRSFDWSAARAWRGHPRLLLAGGLRPETVARAVATLRPHGVDVASGVEAGPGLKDAAAIHRFVLAARQSDPVL